MLVIRRADQADAPALSALAERTFNDTFAASNTAADIALHNARSYGVEIQRAELAAAHIVTLLAEADGRAIAFAQVRDGAIPDCVATRPTLELWRFYVDQPAIGSGVAQALMRAVLACAAERALRSIWLGVWERNPRAIAFYRKHGFVEVGSHDFLFGNDVQTDLVFERPL